MVRIAIAGGTDGLGRTLLDELAQGDDHVLFVLSRKVVSSPSSCHLKIHCLPHCASR